MEEPAESPTEDASAVPLGFVARHIRLIKLSLLALAVLLPLLIGLFFFLRSPAVKSPAKKPETVAAKTPAVVKEPVKELTPEEKEAAEREAQQKRLAVLEAHNRILSESKVAGEKSPVPTAIKPAAPAEVSKPAQAVAVAPPPEKPAAPNGEAPTPLGRLGYGVSKDSVEGLTTLIETMNKAEAAKNKPRK